jgi:glutathione S-transferase
MPSKTSGSRFQLYYWPIPFRGCFVSYLFAYRGVPLLMEASLEENKNLISRDPGEQAIPFMGPPVLRDLESGRTLSQMPAIVLYVAHELDLLPKDQFDAAMCMKVLMDCNDVLMEICRYNGSIMWSREEWTQFRSQRFPRWLRIFEESLKREFIGEKPVSFADVGVFALFGNMIRCLPELEADILAHAPETHALCLKIGSQSSLAEYVSEEEKKYGKLYCGGQIEASIRKMLAQDVESS